MHGTARELDICVGNRNEVDIIQRKWAVWTTDIVLRLRRRTVIILEGGILCLLPMFPSTPPPPLSPGVAPTCTMFCMNAIDIYIHIFNKSYSYYYNVFQHIFASTEEFLQTWVCPDSRHRFHNLPLGNYCTGYILSFWLESSSFSCHFLMILWL